MVQKRAVARTASRRPAAVAVVRRFIERINAHDVDGIVSMLSRDHRFVDSLGTVFEGADTLRGGWRAYFRMVPDYSIEVDRICTEGADVIVIGSARGTYTRDGVLREGNAWHTPAAWLATVSKGAIREWRVFADNEPIRRQMREAVI